MHCSRDISYIIPPTTSHSGGFRPTSQVRKLRLSGGRRSPLGAAPWRWFGLWASSLAPEEFCVGASKQGVRVPSMGPAEVSPTTTLPHEDLQQTLTAPNNFVRVSTDDT